MGKKCWICKNDEDALLQSKNDIIKYIRLRIDECEDFEKSIIDTISEKLNFTAENKTKIQNIKSEFQDITSSAFLENKESFISLEPDLEILYKYYIQYYGQNYNRNAPFKYIRDIIQNYLKEPLQERYSNEIYRNENIKNNLLYCMKELELKTTFFIEKDFNISVFGFSEPVKSILQSSENAHNALNNTKKVFLCPYCTGLLKEASSASFEIKEAQKRAEEEAMHDEWDDD